MNKAMKPQGFSFIVWGMQNPKACLRGILVVSYKRNMRPGNHVSWYLLKGTGNIDTHNKTCMTMFIGALFIAVKT